MAAWARTPTLPTTSSSSPSSSPSSSASSSASLSPPVLSVLYDDLWFYRSVLPVPLPCFPHFASRSPSPPPDSSTLIAACMLATLSSSSLSTPPPPADPEQTQYPYWYLPAPSEDADDKENEYRAYNHGYSSLSESDDDESSYRGYPRPTTGEDEEAYHYYTATSDWDDEDAYNGYPAPSDWDDEDAYNGYPAPSDWEDEQPLHLIKEDQLRAIYPQQPHADLEPEDALSGIYDVADQQSEEMEEVKEKHLKLPSSRFLQEAVSQVSALPHFDVSSGDDQADIKKNLKLWAHAVALTLPWKAAAQARPLL